MDAESDVRTVPLNLAYKGARTYVHGTDLYAAIMEVLAREVPQFIDRPFRMTLHGFARTQCDLIYGVGAERCAKPARGCAEFSLGDRVHGWLAETDRPILARRPYPEDDAVADARIQGQSIHAGAVRGFSAIEVLVALTKRLHVSLCPDQAQWAFTRMDLERPLHGSDVGALQVELVQALGMRLTKSTVRSGGAPLGHIYFSAVNV